MPSNNHGEKKVMSQQRSAAPVDPGMVADAEGKGVSEASHVFMSEASEASDMDAVLALRNLVFDLTQQNGGGHGGSAIGMAAMGVALYKYVMRYNPSDPDWFDRDRFVLSNGHASMFLYALNHLVGFEAWTMDELRGYADPKLDGYTTIAHGHPERQVPGIEVTTGPLGQGVANAVGLAVASAHLGARFNRPGFDVVQSRVYCVSGDGCLMEGVALEAISLAGHLGLDNLVLLYDNNDVTCDGPLAWINGEDVNAKMRACGWHVLDVFEGSHDVAAIVAALREARDIKGKPVMINIRTIIGVGTAVQGTFKAHHGAFDAASVAASKKLAGQDPATTHVVPDSSLRYFRERKSCGERIQDEWDKVVRQYAEAYPDLGNAFDRRRHGDPGLDQAISKVINDLDAASFTGQATREVSGAILERLWTEHPALFGGGADLVSSCKFPYDADTDVFQRTTQGSGPAAAVAGNGRAHAGRFLRYGVREHAMAAISNGLAAYHITPHTQAFLPVTATFFMFYLYAAPAVRMGALSDLPVIHIATHDSIGEGQNGPTHQPVELDSLYRAMPNLSYVRPSDAEETIGAWMLALARKGGPTMLSLGRDPPLITTATAPDGTEAGAAGEAGIVSLGTSRHKTADRGAYVIRDVVPATASKLTLVSCGTNMQYVLEAAVAMTSLGTPTRVVSAPALAQFDLQHEEYRDGVLPKDGTPIVSVEEYVATTWARYTTASIGMAGFGYSASNASNYDRFGLDTKGIVRKLEAYLASLGGTNARVAGWRQL